jgi:tRNA modification GTPase
MQEGIRCIALMNKQDLEVRLTKEQILAMPELSECAPVVLSCSARTGEGIDALQEAIRDQLHADRIFMNSEVLLTGIRHREAAQEALTALQLVRGSIASGVSEDFYTINLMNAYKALGRILGEDVEDDLVEEIFSKFCMGK